MVNDNYNKRIFVVDNFYEKPDEIRKIALSQVFEKNIQFYKGLRSINVMRPETIKASFERIIREPITNWENYQYNGCFQITTAEDPQVYHCDGQKWAGMIYLSPSAPIESGTRTHIAKNGRSRHATDYNIAEAFTGGFLDSTKFEIVDSIGNIYNRLVLMDAKSIHSAGSYFGNTLESGRLIHLFFFD